MDRGIQLLNHQPGHHMQSRGESTYLTPIAWKAAMDSWREEEFRDHSVLVVGGRSSGVDVARELKSSLKSMDCWWSLKVGEFHPIDYASLVVNLAFLRFPILRNPAAILTAIDCYWCRYRYWLLCCWRTAYVAGEIPLPLWDPWTTVARKHLVTAREHTPLQIAWTTASVLVKQRGWFIDGGIAPVDQNGIVVDHGEVGQNTRWSMVINQDNYYSWESLLSWLP